MNRTQVRNLLKAASVFENRQFKDDDGSLVDAWHKLLRGLDADQAMQAMQNHFMSSDRWLMPVHIVEGVRKIRDEIMRDFHGAGQSLEVPDADPDKVVLYLEAVRSQRTRAGDGQVRPVQELVASAAGRMSLPTAQYRSVRPSTPLVVECPKCKAPVGRKCRSATRPRSTPHDERVTAQEEWAKREEIQREWHQRSR